MNKQLRKQEFIMELAGLHVEAHKLGLHRTGHALHEAVRVVGWEVAGKVEAEQRAKKRKRK